MANTRGEAWIPVDPLGEALHYLRMSGTLYCRSELTAPWGLEMPPLDGCLMFHVVVAGRCWLEVEGGESRLLEPGGFALVPHGAGHQLRSEVGAAVVPLFDVPVEVVSERYEVIRHGGGGESTHLICGVVRFDHPAAKHLVSLLPGMVCIDAWTADQGDWIQSTLRFIAAEAMALRPGGETVITRLADILVIQAIRCWIERDGGAETGWLAALQDDQIGAALALVHRDPAHPWTNASLAKKVGMSRSAFAARFTRLAGEPVMQYITRWRMHVALATLTDSKTTVAELALTLGYQSEAAFSRAFKRIIGLSPGAARKQAAAAEQPA